MYVESGDRGLYTFCLEDGDRSRIKLKECLFQPQSTTLTGFENTLKWTPEESLEDRISGSDGQLKDRHSA